ncbi:transposase [Roseococcus thiosulfatophilus]|uniref:transposase n=1 Tax=Roseococcus thiosulfatophilus TaxID=35813 RepID=UPI001A8D1E2F|nr:transposase [Roseococcus thiosulfatophilus]
MSYAPRIPIRPLTDLEWHALLPYVLRRSPQGRQIGDLRARMNAIFRLTATDAPWKHGEAPRITADSLARYYRRLTHAGLWERLLQALHDAAPSHPLRAIEALICRAARRAHRLRGLRLLVLARRLGFRRALNGPPWLLPHPDLSESLLEAGPPAPHLRKPWLRVLKALVGRRSIPRAVRRAWV